MRRTLLGRLVRALRRALGTSQLQAEIVALRDELRATSNELAAANRAAESTLISVLHQVSQKLDAQPWAHIYGLHTKIDSLPLDVLYTLSEKIDILLHHRNATDRTDLHISAEIDRLDGYLLYHLDQTQTIIAAQLKAEIGRLDKTHGTLQ